MRPQAVSGSTPAAGGGPDVGSGSGLAGSAAAQQQPQQVHHTNTGAAEAAPDAAVDDAALPQQPGCSGPEHVQRHASSSRGTAAAGHPSEPQPAAGAVGGDTAAPGSSSAASGPALPTDPVCEEQQRIKQQFGSHISSLTPKDLSDESLFVNSQAMGSLLSSIICSMVSSSNRQPGTSILLRELQVRLGLFQGAHTPFS